MMHESTFANVNTLTNRRSKLGGAAVASPLIAAAITGTQGGQRAKRCRSAREISYTETLLLVLVTRH